MSDEAQTEAMYTRSNGLKIPVRTMAFPHLKSAYAKLAAEIPGPPELDGMAAEIERRNAEFEQSKSQETLP